MVFDIDVTHGESTVIMDRNNNDNGLCFQPATPTRTIASTPLQSLPHSLTPPKRLDTPILEEPSDLEELEQFAKTFKQRRIKLGFTQVRTAGIQLTIMEIMEPAVMETYC